MSGGKRLQGLFPVVPPRLYLEQGMHYGQRETACYEIPGNKALPASRPNHGLGIMMVPTCVM